MVLLVDPIYFCPLTDVHFLFVITGEPRLAKNTFPRLLLNHLIILHSPIILGITRRHKARLRSAPRHSVTASN